MLQTSSRISNFKEIADLVAVYAKWGSILVGGFCLLLYSHEIGQFPEGLNLGEGLAFYLVCAGFWVAYTLYAAVTTAMGSLLMAGPALLHQKFINRRSRSRVAQPDMHLVTDYSMMWDTPVIGLGLLGFVIWLVYVSRHPVDGILFLAQPLLQGFLVGLWLTTRRRLHLLRTGLVFQDESNEQIARKRSSNEFIQKGLLIAIAVSPLLLAADRTFLVDAAFRTAQLRKDSATIHVKQPWAARVKASTLTPTKSFLGDNYVEFDKVKVLLRSVGSKVVIELPQSTDKTTTRLSIPSEAIYIE